jgi:Bacteriocin-protection, YdeI or OmpD-Associated/Domain of unknown function (DUF1905)
VACGWATEAAGADTSGVKFRTSLRLEGKTATGLVVPAEVVEGLGSSKRPAVRVRIGSYSYRSTIAPRGGSYMLPVSAEVRAGAGIAAGDNVDVEVELDTEPREVEVPPDLAAALDAAPAARAFFDALSYSNRLRHVLAVEEAKTPETRQRRIDKAVAALRDGRK